MPAILPATPPDNPPTEQGSAACQPCDTDNRPQKRLRKTYPAKLKARVVLESLKGAKTLDQLAVEYAVDRSSLCLWRQELEKRLPALFDDHMLRYSKTRRELELERENSHLKMRLTYLKRTRPHA